MGLLLLVVKLNCCINRSCSIDSYGKNEHLEMTMLLRWDTVSAVGVDDSVDAANYNHCI